MKLRLFLLLLLALLLVVVTCKKDDEQTPAGSVTVTSPNGGENWAAGSSHAITWTDNDVTAVTISLSTDGGGQWTAIASNVNNTHTYSWTVPASVGTTCRIRVADASDASVYDDSDANFAIAAATQGDHASGPVGTGEPGIITTPEGAQITVPEGAVPAMADGSPATIIFSIEEELDFTPTLPAGETLATAVYRFGPGGFVFAQPVEVAIPVSSGAPDNYAIYRVNPNTQQLEALGARYDSATHTIRAQTVAFSPLFGTTAPTRSTAAGCIHVVNLNFNYWVRVYVETYQLTYPDQDLASMPDYGLGGLWAPVGHIGWASEGNFYMPQGIYTVCVQYGEDQNPNHYSHYQENVTISEAWHYLNNPNCQNFTVGSPVTPDTGMCVCIPTPSVPVGTGDIQVSLTWYVDDLEGVDMDLHLYEPDSTHIYYGDPQSPSGGTLDRDDTCGDFTNGTTENIYYTSNPPVGQYIVKVHYFGDCGEDNHPTQAFSVRTVVQGNTQTFDRSLAPGEMIEITRFSITGAGPAVYLPADKTVKIVANTPAK